jgi:hypothetical protein
MFLMAMSFSIPLASGADIGTSGSPTADCISVPSAHLKQVIPCEQFSTVGSPSRDKFLPYDWFHERSVVSIEGDLPSGRLSVRSLTLNQCKNPYFLDHTGQTNPSIHYIFFEAGYVDGICSLQVTFEGDNQSGFETLIVKVPIQESNLDDTRDFFVEGFKYYGVIQSGITLELPKVTYVNKATGEKLNNIAPTYWTNNTPQSCAIIGDNSVISKFDGACLLTVYWPQFYFGGHYYWADHYDFVIFDTKKTYSKAEIAAKKKAAEELAKKKIQELKLCSESNQNKLRNSYKSFLSAKSEAQELYKQYDYLRLNALYGGTGGKDEIIISRDTFKLVARYRPAIESMSRLSGGSYYMSKELFSYAVSGALQDSISNQNFYLAQAQKAFKVASKGCQQVVGPPD